jgi:signal transduction histidine kinase
MATLLERAVALIRAHPDAAGVTVTVKSGDPARTMAILDGKQIERAIYNLLLNACQSAHLAAADAQVIATLDTQDDGRIILEIKDNGPGVPEKIRTTLFEPFVSEGKQKGSGLGLTLAYCVAAEHGGEVILVSSRPGETIFRMLVARGFEQQDAPLTENRNIVIAE